MKKLLVMMLMIVGMTQISNAQVGGTITKSIKPVNTEEVIEIYVSNKKLENETTKMSLNKEMFPLRVIAENLGYKIEWNEKIGAAIFKNEKESFEVKVFEGKVNKNKVETSVNILLENGKSFVDMEFLKENLKTIVYKNEFSYSINSIEKMPVKEGVITSVEKNRIMIGDFQTGTVFNVIDDITIIKDENGKVIKFTDLKEKDKIKVVHMEMMTMSLPPITNALIIEKLK